MEANLTTASLAGMEHAVQHAECARAKVPAGVHELAHAAKRIREVPSLPEGHVDTCNHVVSVVERACTLALPRSSELIQLETKAVSCASAQMKVSFGIGERRSVFRYPQTEDNFGKRKRKQVFPVTRYHLPRRKRRHKLCMYERRLSRLTKMTCLALLMLCDWRSALVSTNGDWQRLAGRSIMPPRRG